MTKVTASMRRRVLGYGLLALVVSSCSKRDAPEQELRRTMAAMQDAFKAGHVDDFMDHVAADFVREDGSLRRDDLRRLVALAALRNRDALIVADVGAVTLVGERANVVLTVRAVGGQGGLLQAPLEVRTGWRREGRDWKVLSADWSSN